MYRELIRAPVQQTLMLIWLFSLFLVIYRPLSDAGVSELQWAGSIMLFGLFSVLLAGELRTVWLIVVAIVSVLFAGWLVSDLAGYSYSDNSGLTLLYALLLWNFVCYLLNRPVSKRVIGLLNFRGGWGESGGYKKVETLAHWSGFTLAIVALLGPASLHFQVPGIPLADPFYLTLAMILFLQLARHFKLKLHAHLFVLLGFWMALSLNTHLSSEPSIGYISLDDGDIGLVASLYGLAIAVAALQLSRRYPNSVFIEAAYIWAVIIAGMTAVICLTLEKAGWAGPVKLGLSGITLLITGYSLKEKFLSSTGTVLTVVTLCWGFSEVRYGMPPFELRPGGGAEFEQWLVLAAITLTLTAIDRFLIKSEPLKQIYREPLYAIAGFMYLWTLLGTIILLPAIADNSVLKAWFSLALMAAILLATLFPLHGEHTQSRGMSVAATITALLGSLVVSGNLHQMEAILAFGWAYFLWFTGTFGLPYINKHLKRWAISGDSWPWFGLIVLCLYSALTFPTSLTDWRSALLISGYLFLLSRTSPGPAFTWGAVFFLFWSGINLGVTHDVNPVTLFNPATSSDIAIEKLIWANILMLLIPFWKRKGEAITSSLGIHYHVITKPLIIVASATCIFWTIIYFAWTFAPVVSGEVFSTNQAISISALIALTLTYLHLSWHSRMSLFVHFMLLSIALITANIWNRAESPSLIVLLSLWVPAITFLSIKLDRAEHWFVIHINDTLKIWAMVSFWLGVISLFTPYEALLSHRLIALAILAGTAFYLGWTRYSFRWMLTSMIMVLCLMHGIWMIDVPLADYAKTLPWYALQSSILAWVLIFISEYYKTGGNKVQKGTYTAWNLVIFILITGLPWITLLAIAEWALPSLAIIHELTNNNGTLLIYGQSAILAYLGATLILSWLSIRRTRKTQSERWVYAVTGLTLIGLCFLRIQLFGLAPVNPWDTAAIMALAFGLFWLEKATLSHPVFHLTMALPLLAVATVPYQQGSIHSTLTLLAAGALYLFTRRTIKTETPLYLSLLAVNGAIYLWVPSWSAQFGLLQVYLVPVSLSILLLLHLHKNELKQNVLHSSRLAVLSLLYAATTADVFLVNKLAIFALALAISFGSTLIGIALRIRAFLYTGVVFLVLNVIGQLILLYPEQRLGKALMLIIIGALVTGAMIWLNIKREMIMERIRIFRADLVNWD